MSFLSKVGSKLFIGSEEFKTIGFNYYGALNTSKLTWQKTLAAAQRNQVKLVRMWCFDFGKPPSDSPGNFRYLDYPLGTNLISNGSFETDTTGWTLASGYTRVNETAKDGSYSVKQVTPNGYNSLTSDLITVTENTNYVLTFWRKMSVLSGMPPVLFIKNAAGTTIKDAGYSEDTAGLWVRKQVIFNSGANTQVRMQFVNWSGNAVGYFDKIHLGVQSAPTLTWREDTLKQLDMIVDEAGKKNIKLQLVFADNTPNYDTKKTYVDWANTVYGAGISPAYPYVGFYENSYCKQMYKDFLAGILGRVNTINGKTYNSDDTIAVLELGNELRVDRSEGANVNTINSENLTLLSKSGGWIDEMSTYIKTIDSNHLVASSSCSHGYQWVSGDSVFNGTFYGVDYNIIATLPNVDILSFHCYPTQGGGELQLLKYGQKLGHPDAISGDGFKDQLRDYVRACEENGKVAEMGEVGLIKEAKPSIEHYPLWPRHVFFQQIFRDWYDCGGSIMLIWSATTGVTGGSYSVVLEGVTDLIQNMDDRPLMSLIQRRNYSFRGDAVPIVDDYGIDI